MSVSPHPTRGPVVDHLVVAAATLDEGATWIRDRLGVETEPGGEHPAFGTHNRLLSLGPSDYLEVLAVNPAVPKPCAAYPLGLDLPHVRARLERGPFVLTWVVRVTGLTGEGVRELSRGEIRWRAIPRADGALPLAGALPAPIEWLTTPPWTSLPDRGVRLESLTLATTEPERLRQELGAWGWPIEERDSGGDRRVRIVPDLDPVGAGVRATLRTPAGLVELT
ncbi:MAG: VOC family protein [Dermatophilaceae bacterium]